MVFNRQLQQRLGRMTLEEKVSQLFIVPIDSLSGKKDPTTFVDDSILEALREFPVGGVIAMGSNLSTPKQFRALTSSLHDIYRLISHVELFICIDEEGGPVSRIGNKDSFPNENVGSAHIIGELGDVRIAYDAAFSIGSYLRSYGVDVNFAPVADIDSPAGGIMRERSFGSECEKVSSMVEAQIRGFADAGILSCVKHFPGIGASSGNAHLMAVAIRKTVSELEAEDLRPFYSAVKNDVPMVMVGHASYFDVTGDDSPASLSRKIIIDKLRRKMGFRGLVVSDAMTMGSIASAYDDDVAAIEAINAGIDIVLMPQNYRSAIKAVCGAVRRGEISKERIDESVGRVLGLKAAFFEPHCVGVL